MKTLRLLAVFGFASCVGCSDDGSGADDSSTGGVAATNAGSGSVGGSQSTGGSTGGSPMGAVGGRSMAGAGGSATARPGADEQCNDLVLGDINPEIEVVREAAPESLGGDGLEGTYDLVKTALYVRDGINSVHEEVCANLAQINETGSSLSMTMRYSKLSNDDYAIDMAVGDVAAELLARANEVHRLDADRTHLMSVVGSERCSFSMSPSGEGKETTTVMNDPDDLGVGFTVDGATLTQVSWGAGTIGETPACEHVETYRRR
jgi:hypothetical protein